MLKWTNTVYEQNNQEKERKISTDRCPNTVYEEYEIEIETQISKYTIQYVKNNSQR